MATLIGCVAIHQAHAQNVNVVEKGTSLVNVGVGINNGALPINVSYDYGVVGNLFDDKSALTVGGLAGALIGKDATGVLLGARLGLHYHFIPELDTYLSVMLGYDSLDGDKKSSKDGNFAWGTHLGARYMFSKKMGAFAELGYGYSFANIGVVFRF